MKTNILVFGSKSRMKPTYTWENGCRDLNIELGKIIRKENPDLSEIQNFFQTPAEWIYFGGHFVNPGDYEDYGKFEYPTLFNAKHAAALHHTTRIAFDQKSIYLEKLSMKDGKNEERIELKKGTAQFQLDRQCKLILVSGCSVFAEDETLQNFRYHFNNPVILGSAKTTDYKITDTLLGGSKHPKKNFFENLKNADLTNNELLRNAWLTAAIDSQNKYIKTIARALDPDGTVWGIEKGKITRLKKIN
jgi:hypothetical protein